MLQPLPASFGAVAFNHRPAISETDAQYVAGVSLCRDICASGIAADFSAVWDLLTHLPDNMLPLLETPQGWYVLAVIAADDFGFTGCIDQPNIH